MSSYDLENSNGQVFRLSLGAGPDLFAENNLARSCFQADKFLEQMPDGQLDGAFDHFYFNKLQKLDGLSSNPRTALGQAIGESHLVLEQLDSGNAAEPEIVDKRASIRSDIQRQMNSIIAQERNQAMHLRKALEEEPWYNKGRIYLGAGMVGFGKAAWGLATWLKDVNDVANPLWRQYREIKALGAAQTKLGNNASLGAILSEQRKQAEFLHNKELVEAIGFDPSQVTMEQVDKALDMAGVVMDDPELWRMFKDFAWDYLDAQHATELTEVAGGGVFELVLTIALIAATGGLGAVAALGSQVRLVSKFRKIGDLLKEFADITAALVRQRLKRAAKSEGAKPTPSNNTPYDPKNVIGEVEVGHKKGGGETGSITKKDKTPEDNNIDENLFDDPIVNSSKFEKTETLGRRVYKNTEDVQPGKPEFVHRSVHKSIRQKVKDGWTNKQLMENGYAPIGPDGKQINLHHVLGKEPGPMVEVTSSIHKKYHKPLHGLVEDGNSFRNDSSLAYNYEKFRKEYWKTRSKDF